MIDKKVLAGIALVLVVPIILFAGMAKANYVYQNVLTDCKLKGFNGTDFQAVWISENQTYEKLWCGTWFCNEQDKNYYKKLAPAMYKINYTYWKCVQ